MNAVVRILGAAVCLALALTTLVLAGPAAAETVTIFAADCSTPKTFFQLGDTVCASVGSVGGDLNNIWLRWVAPGGTVVAGSPSGVGNTVVTSDPQNFTFTLPTSGVGAERGIWKAQTANVSDSAARVAATFRVPRMSVIGVHRSSDFTSYVRNTNTTGFADGDVVFGQAGDIGFWGDWSGTGLYTPGFYRPSDGTFHISDSAAAPAEDHVFAFGPLGGQPLIGDWVGDGKTRIGVRVGNTFLLRNTLDAGPADTTFDYGLPTDQVVTGDWDGDGIWTMGVYRDGVFFLRNSNTTGIADMAFAYGLPGDTGVAGNWNAGADGTSKPGIYRPSESTFYLRNSLDAGPADTVATFGISSDVPALSSHNDSPVVVAGGTLGYTEGQAATAIDPALTVTDMDNAALVGATIEITGNCAAGQDVLSFVDTATITATGGGCSLTLTGTDSLANYQAALRNVKYNNTSNSPSPAARTVTWLANDGSLIDNLSAAGVTSTITVASVNSVPQLTAGGGFTYTEGDAATAIDTTVNVTDADSPNLQSATVQITTNCSSGQDVLSFADQNGITGAYTAATCLMTLTGSSSVANYQTALRDVKYNNTSNAPSTAARTVTWQVNDGTDNSNTPTSTITVISVNSVPQITAGGGFTYTEGDPATAIDTTVTVTDADSVNLQSATVQITTNCLPGEDVLSFANQNGISGVSTPASCLMTLTGSSLVANYQTALQSVKYNNTSENPSNAARTVTWQVNDGTDNSTTTTSTITVVPVNDAPVGVIDRAHDVTGNVRIQVTAGSGDPKNLLNGVTDPEGNGLVAQVDGSSLHSGTVLINADGTYTYNPKAGRTGADVVKYKVCDNQVPAACSAVKNLTLNISGMIWFIDNNAAAGDGRLTNPFNTIAAFTGINDGGADHPAAGQTIFIHRNTATDYTGPLTLLNNQKVLGKGGTVGLATFAGITLAPDSDALPTTGGTAPIITTSSGGANGVTLAQGNSLRGFTVGNTAGAKIFGNNFGTLTVGDSTSPDVTLNGTGKALDLTTGTFAATAKFISVATTSSGTQGINLNAVGGTLHLGSTDVSNSTTQGISVIGSTANVTFGNTSVTGGTEGIRLENNASGTRTFGTLSITNNSTTGFVHTNNAAVNGGGLTNVTGTTTITNPGGMGILIEKASASNGVTFANVSVTGSGGTAVRLGGAGLGNAGNVTFADLDITPDNSQRGLHATENTGTITTTSGSTISTVTANAVEIVGVSTASRTPLAMVLDSVSSTGGTNNIVLTNVSGSIAMNGGALSGASGAAVSISGSTATATYAGTVTNSGSGISLTNNTGATINLSGNLTLTTGANAAFTATGGGTVNVSATNNNLTTTTGTAVNLNGIGGTIGLKNVTANLAAAGGAANGIVIQNTTAGFSFAVEGDGANTALGGNASGGTISRMAGADGAVAGNGVYLDNTGNVTLRRMAINGVNQNHGIRGNSVTNFNLQYSTVSGTNGNNSGLGEGSVVFDNLLGAATITNCLIEGGFSDNLNVINTTGTLDRLVITGSTFGFNGSTNGNNSILIEVFNPGTLKWTLQSSTIKGARSDWVNAQSSGGSGIIDTIIGGAGVGNTFDNLGANAHPAAVANGNRLLLNANGTHTFNVSNNTLKGSLGNALAITGGTGTSVMTGRIQSNDIGVAGTNDSGSTGAGGISVQSGAGTDITVLVDGNDVRQYNNHGIIFTLGDEMGNVANISATVSNNTVNTPGTLLTDFNGFHVNSGTVSTDDFTACFNISSNNFTGGGKGGVSPNNNDLRLRQRQGTTIQLPGYTGPARDNGDNAVAEVVTYLGTGGLKNNQFGSATANSVSTGGGYVNSPGGAACTLPP